MCQKILLSAVAAVFLIFFCDAQRLQVFTTGKSESFRGLSAVTEKVVWVSGTKGTVGKTLDGGNTWTWYQVKGYETRDFRDIEAFDVETAVIMAVAEPAVILRTSDGGKSWKESYSNATPGMFLDAMYFRNDHKGYVVGDPINGKFFLAQTNDGGRSWKALKPKETPSADTGEACFAASGSNIYETDNGAVLLVSGGRKSRMFNAGAVSFLGVVQGKESTGANSVAVWQKTRPIRFAVVGGDFAEPNSREGNATISKDGGKTWIKPSNPPYGYRSCVEFVNSEKLVSCGINGVDISLDEGINWDSVSGIGFHVCKRAGKSETVFLAGGEGRIAKLVW